MKFATKLGRFFDIDLHVHGTLWILLAIAALIAGLGPGGAGAAVAAVVFLAGIFASVALHEYGHALMARRFGHATRSIVLWPLGGMAQLESMPSRPGREALVALAGPAVNFGLAAALFVVGPLPGWLGLSLLPETTAGVAGNLLFANLALGVFNLLPAFPMDGGRVLRALLSARMGRVRSTEIAVRAGRGVAVLMLLVGVFFNPMLCAIALFLWIAGGAELRATRALGLLPGRCVGDVMERTQATVLARARLRDAAAVSMESGGGPLLVQNEVGGFVGVLTRQELEHALRRRGADARVEEVVRRDAATCAPDDAAEPLGKLLTSGRVAVVESGGDVVGVVSLEGLFRRQQLSRVLERLHGPDPKVESHEKRSPPSIR